MPEVSIDQAIQLALQHHKAARHAEAGAIYQQILAAAPNHPAALHLLGVLMYETRQPQQAIDLITRAIAVNPSVPEFHWNLARIFADFGRHDRAIEEFRQALALDPEQPDVWNDLGNALQIRRRLQESIVAYHQALARLPGHADALNNLGNALREDGQIEEAVAQLRLAIQHRPNFPEAYNNLGNALLNQGKFDESIASYDKALALRPDYVQAMNNRGGALRWAGRLDEAIAAFHQALSLKPDFADPHNNLGITLIDKNDVVQGISHLRRAIELRNDHAEAHHALGMALLLQGDFKEGWTEYEWRWRVPEMAKTHQPLDEPQWKGEPLNGRRLFLHAEQGYGDTIQLVRYVSLAAKCGGKVILACQPEMARLFKSVEGFDELLVEGSALPPIDIHCPLASLPLAFQTDIQSIPVDIPYLRADEEISSRWRKRLEAYPGRLKVGLAWASRPKHKLTRHKSITLKMLATWGNVKGIQFVSLQKGEAAAEPVPDGLDLVDWTNELTDFADTAGLIDNLDLVVTVDTAVAHLAGALGKPVWVMLPFSADWRWLLDRPDSPWYPTMRLFRPPAIGDWQNVIDQITRELACLAR